MIKDVSEEGEKSSQDQKHGCGKKKKDKIKENFLEHKAKRPRKKKRERGTVQEIQNPVDRGPRKKKQR